MRGWGRLYRTSVGLGARYLVRHGYLREAVIRVVVPLDPSRYLELPETMRELAARPGERVLDLASPKLLAVALARAGVEVVSVDQLESEIESWRKLTAGEPRLRLEVGRRPRAAVRGRELRRRLQRLRPRAHPRARGRGGAPRARAGDQAGPASSSSRCRTRASTARTGVTRPSTPTRAGRPTALLPALVRRRARRAARGGGAARSSSSRPA